MTHEQRAKWVGRGFILLIALVIIAVIFAPNRGASGDKEEKPEAGEMTDAPEKKDGEVIVLDTPGKATPEQIRQIFEEAAERRGGLVVGIIHCHVPANPESEQMADILNNVARKYGGQVQVVRVDIIANPQIAEAEKVTQPPKVVMMVGEKRACKFQGLWTQSQVEWKVEELLRGLERMGRDWRPEVPGMKPASQSGS